MASGLMSRMMKKAAASSSVIIPLASRTTPLRRKYTTANQTSCTTISTTNLFRSASTQTHHRFSGLAEGDDFLLSLIQSQIDSNEKLSEAPRGFPFKIVDNPGKESIILTREYEGEEIEVKVYFPTNYTLDGDDEEEEVPDDQKEVHFDVSVSNGSGLTLKLYAMADATTDGIRINYFSTENPNASSRRYWEEPNFSDLDVNLQKTFHNYLEVRGLEPSNTKFIWNYMVYHRKQMECTTYLQDLKTFILE